MVDTKLLIDKIEQNGKTIETVAKGIGVDKSTFYRKLKKAAQHSLYKKLKT